jgi:hypothetical protein
MYLYLCYFFLGEGTFEAICKRPICMWSIGQATGIGPSEEVRLWFGTEPRLLLDGPNAVRPEQDVGSTHSEHVRVPRTPETAWTPESASPSARGPAHQALRHRWQWIPGQGFLNFPPSEGEGFLFGLAFIKSTASAFVPRLCLGYASLWLHWTIPAFGTMSEKYV